MPTTVLMMISFVALVTFLPLVTAAIDRHVVPCNPGQKVCRCRESADECEFTLLIEELQTFVAYELEGNDDPAFVSVDQTQLRDIVVREEEGRPFYINSTGSLIPSFPVMDDDGDSDCITYNEDFDGAQCTVPITADGLTYRPCIAVNGQVPGPTLVVFENQVIVANVINAMVSETISIHWHGINQRNTPWMDGAIHVNQCPIGPSESFRYYFKADPTGTFWYHSHRVTQRADGLFGALVIHESLQRRRMLETELQRRLGIATLIDNPSAHTVNLHEWDSQSNLDRFTLVKGGIGFFPGKPLGAIPVPAAEQQVQPPYVQFGDTFGPDGLSVGDIPFVSGLINGKGRNKNVPFERSRLEVFSVENGGTYRFRLIGAQSQFAYKFSIDEHTLVVIATDGYLIEPVETHYIILHTGERYDFVLIANQPNRNKDDYWIRAETLEVDFTSPPPYPSLGNVAEGILHYGSSPPPRSTSYEAIRNASVPFDPERCGTIAGGCIAVNCPFRAFHPSYNINRCINAHELSLLWPTPSNELPSANIGPDCQDCELFFNIGSDTDSINGVNMELPPVPLQTQKESVPDEDFCRVDVPCSSPQGGEACSCIHVRTISSFNKTIRFVLSSVGNEVPEGEGSTHPMHLHGHHFHVLDIGYGTYANGNLTARSADVQCPDPFCSLPSWRGTPPTFSITNKTVRKDTVMVPGGGYVVIQFLADNPGFWFMHCHIIADLLEGMAVVINEVESRHNPAPPGYPKCGGFVIQQDQFYESLAFDPDSSGTMNWMSMWVLMTCLGMLFGFCH